jgi:hypothetical protein
MTQKQDICLVNFVRKKQPEIQYLHARIRKQSMEGVREDARHAGE